MKMKMAILFDMDGLMIDSERVTFDGYQYVLKKYGKDITLKQYQTFLGRNVVSTYSLLKEYYGKNFPSEDVVKKVHVYLEEVFETEGIPVKPGLYDLLEYIKKNRYKCAVVTSSSRHRAMQILEKIHVEEYFDVVVCGDDISKGKPDPEIYRVALHKLHEAEENCLVLEDAQTGIEAAYRANIDVIAIPDMKYPDEKYKQMTKCIYTSLHDVIAYLEQQKES